MSQLQALRRFCEYIVAVSGWAWQFGAAGPDLLSSL